MQYIGFSHLKVQGHAQIFHTQSRLAQYLVMLQGAKLGTKCSV
jgi:hypothetical protein